VNGLLAIGMVAVVLAIVAYASRGASTGSRQCPVCGAHCAADAATSKHCGYAWSG